MKDEHKDANDLESGAVKMLKNKLSAILTITRDDASAAMTTHANEMGDLAEIMGAMTDDRKGSREWIGQTMAGIPLENWRQRGEVFVVTPTANASLRYLLQDEMGVTGAENMAAVQNRKLLIDELTKYLPNEFRSAPMFKLSKGPINYPIMEDIALTDSIRLVEQIFYLTYHQLEEDVRRELALGEALGIPTPIEYIPAIADGAFVLALEKLEKCAGTEASEEVRKDALVARVLCNLAANRVLLESARIAALADEAAEVNVTLISALNRKGTYEISEIESDQEIEHGLTILFGPDGALSDVEGMDKRMPKDYIDAAIHSAHKVQEQYLGTRAALYRHKQPTAHAMANDTFLFALALAALFQRGLYVPGEFPGDTTYASFPGRGTPARSGLMRPHALELVKTMYGQMVFANVGWELRAERIAAYAEAIAHKRGRLQMLLFQVFKRWSTKRLSNLHAKLTEH